MRLDGAEMHRVRVEVRGMEANELAAKIDRHRSTVFTAEKGIAVSEVTAGRIALALGVPLADLLPGRSQDVAS